MAAHSGDANDFVALTYDQQASSITAMLNSIEAAIEYHARHSPHGVAGTAAESIAQVERLLARLRASFPPAEAAASTILGAVSRYDRPTDPVAEADWDAVR